MAVPGLCAIAATAVPGILILGVGIGGLIGHVVEQVAPPEPPLKTHRWILLAALAGLACILFVALDYGKRRRDEASYEAFREAVHKNLPTYHGVEEREIPDFAPQVLDLVNDHQAMGALQRFGLVPQRDGSSS